MPVHEHPPQTILSPEDQAFLSLRRLIGRLGPILGEHNSLVLSGMLGRSAEELAALEEEGVIGYAPTDSQAVQRPSLDEQVRQGRMRYETDFAEQVAKAYPPPPA